MAKPNYQFEKRQRELAKKKKKEEKKQQKARALESGPEEGAPVDPPTEAADGSKPTSAAPVSAGGE